MTFVHCDLKRSALFYYFVIGQCFLKTTYILVAENRYLFFRKVDFPYKGLRNLKLFLRFYAIRMLTRHCNRLGLQIENKFVFRSSSWNCVRRIGKIACNENKYRYEMTSTEEDIDSFFSRVFGEKNYISDKSLREQIVTHKSYKHGLKRYNEPFVSVGNAVIDVCLLNHYLESGNFSTIPSYKDLVNLRSPARLAEVAKKWNPETATQCILPLKGPNSPSSSSFEKIYSSIVSGLVAVVYFQKGGVEAMNFCKKSIISDLTKDFVRPNTVHNQ